MKLFLVLIISFIFISRPSPAQTMIIEDNHNTYSSPLLLKLNDTIIVKCDTVYLVNKYRFRLYEQASKSILSLNASNSLTLIKEYENNLSTLEASYHKILTKYNQTDSLLQQTIHNNQLTFKKLDDNLIEAKDSLDSIKANLTLAENKLKKDKKRNKISQALWGISGLGIGFLTAIILTN